MEAAIYQILNLVSSMRRDIHWLVSKLLEIENSLLFLGKIDYDGDEMKTAFLRKNFQNFSFELQVIFFAHLATAIFCFFPWFAADPAYEDPFFNTAFGGAGFLIGIFIFLVSISIVLFLLNRLFEYQKVKLSFSESAFYFYAGIEQIVFLVLMWSVLFYISRTYEVSEIRFGFYGAILAQIMGLTAAFLNIKNEKRDSVRNFFSHPETATPLSDENQIVKNDNPPNEND